MRLMAEVITWLMVVYFFAVHSVYLMLTLLAAKALYRNQRYREIDSLPLSYSLLSPPISVLVPAYNEETTITATVESLLQLAYAEFEVVVINDGSKDGTLQVLIDRFGLLPFPEAYRVQIPTQEVRGIYRSTRYPDLRVIDKANGGKADSLNAGINASRYPLFCGVDADSILERDSLQKVVQPFLRSPDMVATGGTIRAANGCDVRGGDLKLVDLPRNIWALFQVMEYLRAFLFGRLGWSSVNAMLIISGAFGLFRKQTVIEVGGYRTQTIGEDMELIVRIHHHMRDKNQPYRIEFVPDPVCWTEVPEDRQTLRNQRIRWQRGLSESLTAHWGLMFSRSGGWPGWVAFPYMVVFEWLGPLVELFGYFWTLYAWWAGFISWTAFTVFLLVSIGLGVLLSVAGVLLEQLSFQMYPKVTQMFRLVLVAVAENLGYRQLNAWWRIVGLYRWATQKEGGWGTMKRKGKWQGGG
jgi:cellulose synthase/poly-beta-1,6-N-acetylglucosamine synthase-like glycosyltransferase